MQWTRLSRRHMSVSSPVISRLPLGRCPPGSRCSGRPLPELCLWVPRASPIVKHEIGGPPREPQRMSHANLGRLGPQAQQLHVCVEVPPVPRVLAFLANAQRLEAAPRGRREEPAGARRVYLFPSEETDVRRALPPASHAAPGHRCCRPESPSPATPPSSASSTTSHGLSSPKPGRSSWAG